MVEKHLSDYAHLHKLLLYTQICSMDQSVVFSYPIISPRVPTTLMNLYSYQLGHHSHSFVTKNGQKRLKNMYLVMSTSITSYSIHGYVLRANKWCSIILKPSWPHIVTLWATLATHLWTKMVKNGWKNNFLTMLISIIFYSTYKYFLRVLIGIQLSYGISQGAY
jgi:ATP-dependent helicase/DNAse subunit B